MYDIVINGGGMIGAATALALAELGLQVAVVETHSPKPFDVDQPIDLRVSAINLASEELLTQLDAWKHIALMRSTVFNRLQVWEQHGGKTEFDRRQLSQSHLGHIIENRIVQLALWHRIAEHNNINLIIGDPLQRMQREGQHWQLSLKSGEQLSCSLVIGADGAKSWVREQLGIGVQGWDYRHYALVVSVATDFEQQDITWQQMTSEGPRAFLPLAGKQASLVWYDSAEKVQQLSNLKAAQLKQQILANFPPLEGDFEVLNSASFPLTRTHAVRYYAPGAVLLGDAAHTINPLAGQGVNLGFKDVAVLRGVIKEAVSKGDNVGATQVLRRYQQKRRPDNLLMMTTMDSIYTLFSNDIKPLRFMRSTALTLLNRTKTIKNLALKYATGLAG